MEDTGFHRLDPRAQEFIPRNYQFSFVPSNFFYSSSPHLPPPPPPPYFHPYTLPPPPADGHRPMCGGSSTLPPSYPPQQPFISTPPAYFGVDHSWPPRTMPSRALLLTMVPPDVSESTVRRELEIFGDVRAVQMDRVREGIVTVHFYDLRESQKALTEIQEQHMQQQYRLRIHYETTVTSPPPMPPPAPGLIAGRAVWAQFTTPVPSTLPDGNNQGTLVIFNLDPDVTTNSLKQTFEAFGHVKELRETPMKRHQRFVEFYDVREAAKALAEMNGKEILGKHIVIEFSRPGGHNKKNTKISASFVHNNCSPSRPSRIMMPVLTPPPPPPPPTCQSSDRRSGYSKGNPKGNGGRSPLIQNSMASLSLNDGVVNTSTTTSADSKQQISSNSKKISKKSGNHQYQQHHQQQQAKGSNKPWKGSRQSKEYDPRFLINEDAITESNCRDSRTTVMIKNIPNKYSQKLLLNMLDNHCIHCNEQIADGDNQPLSSYDFVYLPIDFVNKCNVGYGFVNMTSPEATLRLYKAFHRQSWEVFNSRKICEVTYARLQGVEALKEHFKNSKFPCEADEYMPVIFSPPRDGRLLTDPIPIISRASNNNHASSSTGISRSLSTNITCSSSSYSSSPPAGGSENNGSEVEFQEERVIIINGHYDDVVDGNEDDDGDGGGRSFSSNGGGDGGDHHHHHQFYNNDINDNDDYGRSDEHHF